MIGILIITHETLGAAYQSLARHFFPDAGFEHLRIIGVDSCEDHADIIGRAHTLLAELDSGHGVLILTDIFGATPCNAAMKLVEPGRSVILTGLNAPMLVKPLQHAREETRLEHLAQSARDAAVKGIMLFDQAL